MVNKYVGFGKKLFDFAAKKGEKSNVVSTIVGVKPKLTKEIKKNVIKRNKGSKDLFEASKGRKFNKGGRVGLKRGTFPDHSGDGQITQKDILMAKGVIPKTKKKTMMAKKSKSPMDKQVRQKAAFGGGADMGKVASGKTKTEVKKYEKRAKDASKFLKNKNRSFGSIMREKYMR